MKKWLVLILLLFGCHDTTFTTVPSEVHYGTADSFEQNVPPSVVDTVGTSSPDSNLRACEVLKVKARRVLDVSHERVILLVLADYDGHGTPYVRIIDRPTGKKLGDFPLGQITLPVVQGNSYDWLIYIEVEDPRGFFQCDGGIRFDVPTLPTPPTPTPTPDPPPNPEPPPTPDPDPEPECETPSIGTKLTWTGQGNPTAECAAFGNYVPGTPADFLLCKAGNDREVVPLNFSGNKCPNGKDVSHLTSCVCKE